MNEKLIALEAAILAMADQLARKGLLDTEEIAKDTLRTVAENTWMSDEGWNSGRSLARNLASIKLDLPPEPPAEEPRILNLRLVK